MAKKPSSRGRISNVAVDFPVEHVSAIFTELSGKSLEVSDSGDLKSFSYEIDPGSFTCPDSFRREYLGSVMFSKFDDGSSKGAEIRKSKAIDKFMTMEAFCSTTNTFLEACPPLYFEKGITAHAVIHTARRKIEQLLGDFDWSKVERWFDFGPGSSTRIPRRRATLVNKFSGKPEVTSNCADLARAYFDAHPLWKVGALGSQDVVGDPFNWTAGNRIVTVPKNAEIDRVIAIEPDLNMFFQKGIGGFMRNRLKKVGVNLDDQTRNQVLAKEGSISSDFATIDLSSASDTVSRKVVELLLPPDWLQALEQCRSPKGVLPCGKLILYRKFSSMGNGYTFELESLIFWAILTSVYSLLGLKDVRFCVYGDDLIVHRSAVRAFFMALSYFGFIPNPRKSYTDGPFRESCGKHYFNGADVTPFYVRSPIRRLNDVFLFHNNVLRWSRRGDINLLDSGLSGQTEDLLRSVRDTVPANWRRPRIPDGFGDGAFIGSFDQCCPVRAKRGFEGFRCKVLADVELDTSRHLLLGTTASLLASLWACGKGPTGVYGPIGEKWAFADARFGNRGLASQVQECIPVPWIRTPSFRSDVGYKSSRNSLRLTRARIVEILVPQWADLGPWF